MMRLVCLIRSTRTMVLWRARIYGPMSQGSGTPYCATSASRRLWARADDNSPGGSPCILIDGLSSHAAVGLGKNLFPFFARALDLAPDFFDEKVRIQYFYFLTCASLDYVGRP